MIIDTSHLLVGVNSAANFFLYYLLRKNFRSATWRLLTCKKLPASSGPGMTQYNVNKNYTMTSFINQNSDKSRVQRRATFVVPRYFEKALLERRWVFLVNFWNDVPLIVTICLIGSINSKKIFTGIDRKQTNLTQIYLLTIHHRTQSLPKVYFPNPGPK